jgi:plastocyanin
LVSRLLSRRRLGFAALTIALAVLVLAPAADAANRRIAISNYQWSSPDIHVDLGEHVTWYWVGPDVVHSVTGVSDNDRAIDSDPGNPLPQHPVGDSFQVSFDQPGVYQFQCKLHSTVRGTITVSDSQGDPVDEPDPVPPNRVDLKAPRLRNLQLQSKAMTGAGGPLHFALGENAKLDADYFRLGPGGKRTYAGFGKWRGYLGLNQIRFAARSKQFRARPGRYVAELRATDHENNVSKPRDVRFQITPR